MISAGSDVDNNGFSVLFIRHYFNITISRLVLFFLLNYIIYEKQTLATDVINLSSVSIQVNSSGFLELIIQYIPLERIENHLFRGGGRGLFGRG